MTYKDYLAIFAILLSVISLGLSIWSTFFNRRLKAAELRISLLSKLVELSTRIEKHRIIYREMKRSAAKLNIPGFVDLMSEEEIDVISSQSEKLYEHIANEPIKSAIKHHETYFHIIHSASEQVAVIEARVLKLKERIENNVAARTA